jgi:ABC-type microcin C transport system duplicated ATPase subunit YejF
MDSSGIDRMHRRRIIYCANRPSILLAIEPTGSLDSRASIEIMEIFQDLDEKVMRKNGILKYAASVLIGFPPHLAY